MFVRRTDRLSWKIVKRLLLEKKTQIFWKTVRWLLLTIFVNFLAINGSKNDCGYSFFSSIILPFSDQRWKLTHALLARWILWTNPVTTDLLYFIGASEWKFIVRPVSVGLVYHLDDNGVFERVIRISRDGIDAFSSSRSMLNWSEGCRLLISRSFSSILLESISLSTSSMYLENSFALSLTMGSNFTTLLASGPDPVSQKWGKRFIFCQNWKIRKSKLNARNEYRILWRVKQLIQLAKS